MKKRLLALALAALFVALTARAANGLDAFPLAARSGPRGATLFTAISPAQSGIVSENNYSDPRMWGDRYREFETGPLGTGIAISDYDGDGLPDIFVVSKTESCRLFRNLGHWKFEDVTDKAGVGDKGEAAQIWKQGAAFADVNNDGLLDIYVCRFGAPNLLYINQGNGTFKEEALARGLAVNDASVMAAFCDYDRDGWLDVFVQTNVLDAGTHPKGQRDYLFHNNGDGTFTNVTERAGIAGEAQGHSATWWDFDEDGWPDLYVCNDFAVPDKLYRNNHDGTFAEVIDRVVPHMPFSSMGSDLGDVDNDGHVDLFVAEMAATTHEKDQRTMAVSRSALAEDLPEESSAAPQYFRNALYLNTGKGHVREGAFLAGLAATDWTWSVRFEDLDNDGWLDLFVTNGMHRESHNADLMARMSQAASQDEKVRIERASPVLAEEHLAFRNRGDLQFENVSAAWGLNQRGVSFGAAFGDLDGDGDMDLVYANYQSGVTVLRNDGQSGHSVVVALRGVKSNRFGIGAVVKLVSKSGLQVRPLVSARGYLSTSEPIVHFGLGNDDRVLSLSVIWPSGTVQRFNDLAVDQKYVVTESLGGASAAASVTTAQATPMFSDVSAPWGLAVPSREAKIDELNENPLLPFRQNRRGPALAVGPIDETGRDAIIVAGAAKTGLRVLREVSAHRFASVDVGVNDEQNGSGELDDGPVLLFDADGDGANDLLVTKTGVALPAGAPSYQPKLFLNDGHGRFRPAANGALPSLPSSVGAVASADFNRDGKLDLFIGGRVLPGQYPFSSHSALWLNQGGKFADETARLAPSLRDIGLVTSALWSDVDGDGWPDLLLTLEWGGVKYFHNQQGHGFEDWSEKSGFASAGTGWWTSIVSADFNGDGRPDYAVGNVGLNTQYKASAAHPALLFAGDFKGDDTTQLVEAYYEGDRMYPWRTRKDLGAAIPSLLRKFPRNDLYARASLREILGADKLEAAQRFGATEFNSGVLLSQPDGSYRFEPLPRLAQIAPAQGMVAGDFDGDGRADLYALQNSYAPIPLVGRFDGGLSQLLLGNGDGSFRALSPARSGLIVSGDAKALASVDLDGDGWPDFIATRNEGTMVAFQNHVAANRHPLSVRLRGPRGNPFGIGARITLEFEDGHRTSTEITAGSGYFSQSSATAFFAWSAQNLPHQLVVRWPTGATTRHELGPPFPSQLELSER